MSFGRQLSRGFKQFGRQLSSGANVFGRQLSNSAQQVSSGIGKAERIVSKLERYGPDSVPVVDAGLKALRSGLGAAGDVASLAGVSGQALRAGATGNVAGVIQAGRAANGLVGSLGSNVASAAHSGSNAIGQAAALMAV